MEEEQARGSGPLFFASHLVVFWLLGKSATIKSELGLVFFAWVGIFNMMVVAQFWAYANDVDDPERGMRPSPIVALGVDRRRARGEDRGAPGSGARRHDHVADRGARARASARCSSL